MALLQVDNLKKSFNNKTVLKGVNLQIDKGDVVAIIGPSGSGKTTFLKSINLLEQPDSGTLKLNDDQLDFSKVTPAEKLKIRRKIAMVFQNYALFKNKTALENITEGLIYGRNVSKDQATQRANKELAAVGLLDKQDFYPAQLSGGQQQRIGIARATALDPEIILFDEPTSALDPELVGTVVDDIDKLARNGQTMIVVTHLISFARRVANKVIFFEDGNVLAFGSPEDILDHPKNERIKQFLSAISKDH
ncbi:amino acid ABC transporter ATP-binding protein [Lactobacillus sp. Sy-1]|uniref:amino acid ABC transporter ATP-binding protein n=1 Tax=Lactobacillus sp. Sy-1 TaxID=2109645 RepID=UPI001C5AC59F|nr:amino acid ABC transporter ATP-binding protein [Lactobacillus sp. Sy-1]MBW1606256.1 amino acid ABC transporter ATP-binding protein [Lactobacillus sp. Sy-1]